MALPESERARVSRTASSWRSTWFVPIATDLQYLLAVGRTDPTALEPVLQVLVQKLNKGLLLSGTERALFEWLNAFVQISEQLRVEAATTITRDILEFYCSEHVDSDVGGAARRLSETLKVERPRHYFDLCRGILMSNGCMVIIGAGFSYDSYAPLITEMEGIACSVLYDLKVPSPRDLYKGDEEEAWKTIAGGWEIFQRHMAYTLMPKEPSEQHFILSQLFREGYIKHIVSFNWDDLIEKAYKRLHGVDIPIINKEGQTSDHALWKLHGDVARPDDRWVLPYESGRVFMALEEIARTTTLRTFIIGYREQEQLVKTKLIDFLQKRGGVTRIRPDAPNEPPDSFADNASAAMRKIRDGLGLARSNRYLA